MSSLNLHATSDDESRQNLLYFASGPITMGDVMRTMPWSNSVDVVRCVSNSWLSYINPPLATILPLIQDPGERADSSPGALRVPIRRVAPRPRRQVPPALRPHRHLRREKGDRTAGRGGKGRVDRGKGY